MTGCRGAGGLVAVVGLGVEPLGVVEDLGESANAGALAAPVLGLSTVFLTGADVFPVVAEEGAVPLRLPLEVDFVRDARLDKPSPPVEDVVVLLVGVLDR